MVEYKNCHSLYMGFLVYYFPHQLALRFVYTLSRIARPFEWYKLFLPDSESAVSQVKQSVYISIKIWVVLGVT